MMRRPFLPNQLLECEAELMQVASASDDLGMRLGEYSDAIHFDGEQCPSLDPLITETLKVRAGLDRVEGLLRASELFRKAQGGQV